MDVRVYVTVFSLAKGETLNCSLSFHPIQCELDEVKKHSLSLPVMQQNNQQIPFLIKRPSHYNTPLTDAEKKSIPGCLVEKIRYTSFQKDI